MNPGDLNPTQNLTGWGLPPRNYTLPPRNYYSYPPATSPNQLRAWNQVNAFAYSSLQHALHSATHPTTDPPGPKIPSAHPSVSVSGSPPITSTHASEQSEPQPPSLPMPEATTVKPPSQNLPDDSGSRHQKTASRRTPFTARELFEIVQVALKVKLFEAKRGEKMAREKQMGDEIRGLKITGSDALFKARLNDVLTWHQDPDKAPEDVVKAIEGSTYEGTFGAPLDQLLAMKSAYEGKSDAEKEKMRKKAEEDRLGGEMIRNASLATSRRRSARRQAELDAADADGSRVLISKDPGTPCKVKHEPQVLDSARDPSSIDTTAATNDALPSLPSTPIRKSGTIQTLNSPRTLHEIIEISSSPVAPSSKAPSIVRVKREDKENAVPRGKNLPSIPRTNSKSKVSDLTARKRSSSIDLDDSPPTRNTKRVRGGNSFDIKEYLDKQREESNQFREVLLTEIKKGNEELVKSAQATQQFQNNFLDLIKVAFTSNPSS